MRAIVEKRSVSPDGDFVVEPGELVSILHYMQEGFCMVECNGRIGTAIVDHLWVLTSYYVNPQLSKEHIKALLMSDKYKDGNFMMWNNPYFPSASLLVKYNGKVKAFNLLSDEPKLKYHMQFKKEVFNGVYGLARHYYRNELPGIKIWLYPINLNHVGFEATAASDCEEGELAYRVGDRIRIVDWCDPIFWVGCHNGKYRVLAREKVIVDPRTAERFGLNQPPRYHINKFVFGDYKIEH